MNLGAGLEQVLIDAPQLIQAYLQGQQLNERFAQEDEMNTIIGDMTKMAKYGQAGESMLDEYENEVTPWMSRPGGEGVVQQINDRYQQKWAALHSQTFQGEDPPTNAKPPPAHFIDGPHEIPAMRKYFEGLGAGLDKTSLAILKRDPKALAQYLTAKKQEDAAREARAGLGRQVGDALRGGDKVGLAQLAVTSGDPTVTKAMDLLKEQAGEYGGSQKGVNPKTGKTEYFVTDKNGHIKFLGVNPPEDDSAAKDRKKDIQYTQDRLDKLHADRSKLVANSLGGGPDFQNAMDDINKRIAEAEAELEGLKNPQGVSKRNKVKPGTTHSKPANTAGVKRGASKYSHLW